RPAERRDRDGDVGLAAAVGHFEIRRVAETIKARRCEPEHDFTKGNEVCHGSGVEIFDFGFSILDWKAVFRAASSARNSSITVSPATECAAQHCARARRSGARKKRASSFTKPV